MSLVRLLTAGRSLVGISQPGNRYRLPTERLLPKFEARKNPFRRTAASNPAPAAAAPVCPAKPVIAGETKAKRSNWIAKVRACLARLSECVSALKFPVFRRREGPAGSVRPPADSMVQPELSLDSVKVLRNDLSDSDLEVVLAKPAGANTGEQAGTPKLQEQPSRGTWGKVSDRLLSAVKH